MKSDPIKSIESFVITIPRDTPYLGKLEDGVRVTEKGTFIRPGNRSVYNIADQTVLVKVTTENGIIGWGEGWAIVAPQIAQIIIDELIAPLVIGREPHDVIGIHEDLYDAMRVRGFFGGFYLDAIAALDIAIWDVRGRLEDMPVYGLLGSSRNAERIPAYVSGLPKPTLRERTQLAKEWRHKGFDAIKFAAAVATEGEVKEIEALREATGDGHKILCDMHWRNTDHEAIKLITQMEPYDLYLAEAPCNSEDVEGQAHVAAVVKTPVAIGEELRTIYEFRPRFVNRCMSIIQPEIAHTGLTAFVQICQMAEAFHCRVIPHASISTGIFMAASLHASVGIRNMPYHEYQPSVFDRNLRFTNGTMACVDGFYTVPEGPGLGIEPNEELFKYVVN